MGKYFTVEKPLTVAASKQHAGAFTTGFVMVDWTAIQVPKGGASLRSATMLIRSKGDASPSANNNGVDLIFAKTNTVSLGTVGAIASHRPNNDILGVVEIDSNNFGTAHLQSTAVATLGGDNNNACPPLVLQGDPTTGDNVGYDTLYVGVLSKSDDNTFESINVINDADINSTTPTAIVMAGTGMDVREHFAVGDVLHAQDDILLGTVESIDAAATGPINLTSATSGAGDATTVTNGDTIYNLHPITLVLGFEK